MATRLVREVIEELGGWPQDATLKVATTNTGVFLLVAINSSDEIEAVLVLGKSDVGVNREVRFSETVGAVRAVAAERSP